MIFAYLRISDYHLALYSPHHLYRCLFIDALLLVLSSYLMKHFFVVINFTILHACIASPKIFAYLNHTRVFGIVNIWHLIHWLLLCLSCTFKSLECSFSFSLSLASIFFLMICVMISIKRYISVILINELDYILCL